MNRAQLPAVAFRTNEGERAMTDPTPTPEREPLDPAEDVETVAAAIRVSSYVRMSPGEADTLAVIAVKALDLPGRERALREEIAELATELAEERALHQQTPASLARVRGPCPYVQSDD